MNKTSSDRCSEKDYFEQRCILPPDHLGYHVNSTGNYWNLVGEISNKINERKTNPLGDVPIVFTPASELKTNLLDELMGSIVNRFLEEFVKKQEDYQNSDGSQVADEWGVMAQFMKMNDKVKKLRRPLYEQEILRAAARIEDRDDMTDLGEFNFESTEEILRDLIGHCFLTLKMLKERGQ